MEVSEIKRREEEAVKLARFDEWLLKNGANCSSCKHVQYSEDYRGISLAADVEKGKVVVQVPLSCIITLEVANTSIIGNKLKRMGCSITSKQCYVAIYILEERHALHSFWEPYFDILPQRLHYMPALFDEEDLDYLDASPILDMVHNRRRRYADDYALICKLVPHFAKVATLRQFSWARIIVQSRIFGFYVQGRKTSGLVPMADMVNHGMQSNATWTFHDDVNSFVLIAKHGMQANAPLLDSYGKRGHSGYFLDYGMVLPNPTNVVHVHVNVAYSDSLRTVKMTLLQRANDTYELASTYAWDGTVMCFNFYRVACATSSQLQRIHALLANDQRPSSTYIDLKQMRPVNLANEFRVLLAFFELAMLGLEGYGCSIDDDEALLESKDLNENARNCVLVRLGEKQVFQFYIELATYVLRLFHHHFVTGAELLLDKDPWLHADDRKVSYVNVLITLYNQADMVDLAEAKQELVNNNDYLEVLPTSSENEKSNEDGAELRFSPPSIVEDEIKHKQ